MKKSKDWTEGTIEKKMFMVRAHLSTVAMKAERNYISQYGAVRMTKAEATEMIKNNQRYQNCWVYVTVYEEEEDRGGK
eukprot:13194786-Heterocapsa_arctica.AAC.1